jgi:hypothetical protein
LPCKQKENFQTIYGFGKKKKKGKDIPVTGNGGPEGCQRLRG